MKTQVMKDMQSLFTLLWLKFIINDDEFYYLCDEVFEISFVDRISGQQMVMEVNALQLKNGNSYARLFCYEEYSEEGYIAMIEYPFKKQKPKSDLESMMQEIYLLHLKKHN